MRLTEVFHRRVQDGDGSASNFEQHALANAGSVTPIGFFFLQRLFGWPHAEDSAPSEDEPSAKACLPFFYSPTTVLM